MHEGYSQKPESPIKKEPAKIEAGLDIKIKRLLARQNELEEALEKSHDVLELLDDNPEAQEMERDNIEPLRKEYLENKGALDEIYKKYAQIQAHRGFDSDAFLKAILESDVDNK